MPLRDQTDVMVLYHVDSALYDDPLFAFGMITELTLTRELDPFQPVVSDRCHDPCIAKPVVARRILDHLGLDSTGPPLARVQAQPELLDPGPTTPRPTPSTPSEPVRPRRRWTGTSTALPRRTENALAGS